MPKLFGRYDAPAAGPQWHPQRGALVAANLDLFRGHVQRATLTGAWATGAQSVDMAALRRSIAGTGDSELLTLLDRVDRHFAQPTIVKDGAGGFKTVLAGPQQLSPKQLNELLGALAQGRNDGRVIAGADGMISEKEARAGARWTDTFSHQLAGAVTGSVAHRLDRRRAAFAEQARSELAGRADLEKSISSFATKHAETPEGREAVGWFLRSKLTQRPEANLDTRLRGYALMRTVLKADPDAPKLFAGLRTRKNLSDAELKTFLRTDDLRAFAAKAKTETDRAVGGSYQQYLAGADVAAPYRHR